MTAQVANLVETMDRLGHSTPNASLRYQSQVNGRAVEIAEALSELATSRRDLPSADLEIAEVWPARSRKIPFPTVSVPADSMTFAQFKGGFDTPLAGLGYAPAIEIASCLGSGHQTVDWCTDSVQE